MLGLQREMMGERRQLWRRFISAPFLLGPGRPADPGITSFPVRPSGLASVLARQHILAAFEDRRSILLSHL